MHAPVVCVLVFCAAAAIAAPTGGRTPTAAQLAKVNRCYVLRYEDLFGGYCSHRIDSCNWEGVLEHWNTAGKKEGRIRACKHSDLECYVKRNPDVMQRTCGTSAFSGCSQDQLVALMEHYAFVGRPAGQSLSCDPLPATSEVPRTPASVPAPLPELPAPQTAPAQPQGAGGSTSEAEEILRDPIFAAKLKNLMAAMGY